MHKVSQFIPTNNSSLICDGQPLVVKSILHLNMSYEPRFVCRICKQRASFHTVKCYYSTQYSFKLRICYLCSNTAFRNISLYICLIVQIWPILAIQTDPDVSKIILNYYFVALIQYDSHRHTHSYYTIIIGTHICCRTIQ